MLVQIIHVELRGGRRVYLRFDDGVEGEIDLDEVIRFEGVFARLADPAEFAKVHVDPAWGALAWPGDLDLAPEPLHERLAAGRPGARSGG